MKERYELKLPIDFKSEIKCNCYLKFLIIHSVALASSNASAAAVEARIFLCIASCIELITRDFNILK